MSSNKSSFLMTYHYDGSGTHMGRHTQWNPCICPVHQRAMWFIPHEPTSLPLVPPLATTHKYAKIKIWWHNSIILWHTYKLWMPLSSPFPLHMAINRIYRVAIGYSLSLYYYYGGVLLDACGCLVICLCFEFDMFVVETEPTCSVLLWLCVEI